MPYGNKSPGKEGTDYGSPTATSTYFNPNKPNHYPGADVKASDLNTGDPSKWRGNGGAKPRRSKMPPGTGGNGMKSSY